MFSLAEDRDVAAALAHHARTARRVRLEIAPLFGNHELAREIERSVGARPGVVRVVANPRSARVLIEYAPDAPVLEDLERYARATTAQRARVSNAGHNGTTWHDKSVEFVARHLGTSAAEGLTDEETLQRLETIGVNMIEEEAPPSRFALLASQFTNAPTVMLLSSTVVSILLGDLLEAGAIVTVIALNAAIGYRIERRSEQLLAAWRATELGQIEVIRGGSIKSVPISTLVPGDVMVVRAGVVIGADARIIEAHHLTADEATLTGESEPVTKSTEPTAPTAPLAERFSMLYRGTVIAAGHGRAIVTGTGGGTEIAAVQRLAAEAHAPKGGLQRRLSALSSKLAWTGLAASGLAILGALPWRRNPLEILRDSVALGVAAIPEGMPVTATAALVRAMAHMRERGIVVRRLATAETLGGITVACTDKTGTLTYNRMRVETLSVLAGARPRRIAGDELAAAPGTALNGPIGAVLVACVLNSDLEYQQNGGTLELAGSSTERALVQLAERAGLSPLAVRAAWPRRRLVERRHGVHYVISEHDPGIAFIKGAPEQVVPLCKLSPEAAAAVSDENAALAGDGLRMLAIGWRALDDGAPWRYLGLVALRDPLREGSAEAIRQAARAGIRTVMLTGDQRATAEAITRQAMLEGDVIDSSELAGMLAAPDGMMRLRRVAAIARVTPAEKVAVVEALRAAGEIVAMVGDGINDAPALRAADVGIAVGVGSSDLARQTADVVLEHEDLRSILAAVAEGRAVQDNLRRSIRFQAAGNLSEMLLVVSATFAGQRLIPSLGLMWINLLTDTLPGLALATEPIDADLLARPPAPPDAPILDARDWKQIGRDGAIIAGAAGVAALVGGPLAAFGTIGATQFGYAAACRANDQPFDHRFATMVGGSAALHVFAVASAPMRSLLRIAGNVPIALVCMGLGMAVPIYRAWLKESGRAVLRPGVEPLAKVKKQS